MTAISPTRAALYAFVARHQRFLLTTHVNPDGDAIGSEVAFSRWLKAQGKQVRILNDSPTPSAFAWLAADDPIEVYEEALAELRFSEADALVVLDTGNKQRIGRLWHHLERHVIDIAIVDHHVSHDGFGSVNLIQPELAATAVVVYEIARESGIPIDRASAEALYVGLATDTGYFRYSNTDARCHHMAADLVKLGVDPQETTSRISATAPVGRLRFFGEALASLQIVAGGKLVVLEATPEMFARHGLRGADTEGLVDMPRMIAGVEAVALFSEVETDKVKVSLRSTGRVNIDQVCSQLGGGGHPHAAGVMLQGSRESAKEKVLPEVARRIALLDTEPAPRAAGA